MIQRGAMATLVAVLAALILVAAGCGGSSEESSGEAATETAVVSSEEAGDDSMADDDMATEDDSDDTTGSLSAFADEDCLRLASIGASIAQAVDPTGDFDAEEAAQLYDELADKAPEEIQDDLAVFADYLAEIAEVLADVDLASGQAPSAEDLQALQSLGDVGPEVEQASENLSAWAEENCSVGG